MSLKRAEITTIHPADAATIPASIRGTFHLPPAAHFTRRPRRTRPPNLIVGCQTPNDIADTTIEGTTNPLPADAATIPVAARGAFHLQPATPKPSHRP